MTTTIRYTLENLGCAGCAKKMEAKIAELPDIESVSISFPTKQLIVTGGNPHALHDTIQDICSRIESDVLLVSDAQEKKKEETTTDWLLIRLLSGAFLFTAGIVISFLLPETEKMPWPLILLFLTSYAILGSNVLRKAGSNIVRGNLFDENFLMAVATLGAIGIQDFSEAAGVMLFFGIGEYFEHRAVEKSRNAIMDAVDMRPENVLKVIDNLTLTIPAKDAVIGDIIRVRPGDRIPLDCTVISGNSAIDTSPITGESIPVNVEENSKVLSGCINTTGLLTLKVDKSLSESMVTKILEATLHASEQKPKMDRFISRFAKVYTPIVVGTALFTAIVPSLLTGQWNHWIYTALTFLVISCPCALVLSVPLAFFSGIGIGSKHGILFKNGSSLERIAMIDTVILDKTGTITNGTFGVTKVICEENQTESTLLHFAAIAECSSSHPVGKSIISYLSAKNIPFDQADSIQEIPGKGIYAVKDNDTILCGNRELMKEYQVYIPSSNINNFGTEILIAVNGIYQGTILLSDQIKPDSKETIRLLHKQNIKTVMLTGDNESTAAYVADQVGIKNFFHSLLPQDKLSLMNKFRNRDNGTHPVMFVGDGINDTPVLAGADIGAAMGSGADAAMNAADLVFMKTPLSGIVKAIAIGKSTTKTAKANIIFALAVKGLVMILGFFGLANMWFAVFADSGVAMICIINSIRLIYQNKLTL